MGSRCQQKEKDELRIPKTLIPGLREKEGLIRTRVWKRKKIFELPEWNGFQMIWPSGREQEKSLKLRHEEAAGDFGCGPSRPTVGRPSNERTGTA